MTVSALQNEPPSGRARIANVSRHNGPWFGHLKECISSQNDLIKLFNFINISKYDTLLVFLHSLIL